MSNIAKKIIDLMEQDDSIDAPIDSIKWAKNTFRSRSCAPRESAVRRILAALTIEIAPGTVAYGERSSGGSSERELFFEAESIGIQIRISEAKKTNRLQGQILADGFSKGWAIARVDEKEQRSELDPNSSFSFDGLPKGRLDIQLTLADLEIALPSIES